MQESSIGRLRSRLNDMQRNAFVTALGSPLSVIQGPPGTGKTTTASTIAAVLTLKEKGTIFRAAPSNFAADNFAISVCKQPLGGGKTLRVLRMYSKKRERQMLLMNERRNLHENITNLHEAVVDDEEYLAGNDMVSIKEKVVSNRLDLLKLDEKSILEQHYARLERKKMDEFRVIVSTCGTYADTRLMQWNSDTVNNRTKISTIILDEAGQLNSPGSLHAFRFGQCRTVLLGDQKQLKFSCQSYASQVAGLSISIMDCLKIGGSSVPWTMLVMQHRMTPENRNIVSELTYRGKLTDAPCISTRDPFAETLISECYGFRFTSRVIVIDHNGFDEQQNTSYRNTTEIKLAVNVSRDLVKKCGVPADKITVLSLYEAQRASIEKKLGSKGIAVRNVDAFQGKENDVIILSMGRGGDGIGFSAVPNRLNVAISRSRELLIVLINLTTFRGHGSHTITSFLQLLEENAHICQASSLWSNIE